MKRRQRRGGGGRNRERNGEKDIRGRDVNLLQLGAQLALLGEGDRVGGDDAAEGVAVVERLEGVAGEDAVRDEGDDLRGAVLAQGVGGFGEGAAGVLVGAICQRSA